MEDVLLEYAGFDAICYVDKTWLTLMWMDYTHPGWEKYI